MLRLTGTGRALLVWTFGCLAFDSADFPIDIPSGFPQVFQDGARVFESSTPNVLDGVAEVESHPLNHIDAFEAGRMRGVVLGMVYVVVAQLPIPIPIDDIAVCVFNLPLTFTTDNTHTGIAINVNVSKGFPAQYTSTWFDFAHGLLPPLVNIIISQQLVAHIACRFRQRLPHR